MIRMPRRKVDVKKEISQAFLKRKDLTWSELLEETGISKGSLSKYLRKLIDLGIVETDVDASVRPPSTIYRLRTTKIGRALNYLFVPLKDKIPEFKRKLQTLKDIDKKDRQKEFNKVFAYILFNLLADHLTCFEAALSMRNYAKSKEHAIESYSYMYHSIFDQTAKAILELFVSDPEFEKLFDRSINEVIWIAEEIRPNGGKPSDLHEILKELAIKLQIAKI